MALQQIPTIPETITVHLGLPNQPAENVTVPFPDYIKNVASSEIYPTWPEAAIRANIYAQITYALNRIFNEFYRSQGYDFDITSTTQYDQTYIKGRDIYENISRIVDEIFNNYVVRQGRVDPFFTAYCNGTTTVCDGLSQWETVALAEQGLTPYQILQKFYGQDIGILENVPISANVPSYPGTALRLGDAGNTVKTIQLELNRIAADVQRREALEVRDRQLTRGFAGIVARGLLEQRILKLGDRVVRQRLHRDGLGREAVEQPREVADNAGRDQTADEHDGDDRRRETAALFLRALRLRRLGRFFMLFPAGLFGAGLFGAGLFLSRLFPGRGCRDVRQLRRLARELVRVEQLGPEELVVEIFLARVGVLHEREEVADLHLHAGGELRRLEIDVDDRFFLRQGIVHLLAAVVRAQIRRGQKRQHELRALEMRRDALRPLAAGLDALIVPDAKTARLQGADDLEHGRVVLVRVADEEIRQRALIGAQKGLQGTTSGKISKIDWILSVYHTRPRAARVFSPASQAYGTRSPPRPVPRAMSGLRRPW